MFSTQHGSATDGGRSATRSAVQTGQSAHSTRTVRDLDREHIFTQHGPHLTGGRSAKWSVVYSRTVRFSQAGQSAFSCSLPLHLAMIFHICTICLAPFIIVCNVK